MNDSPNDIKVEIQKALPSEHLEVSEALARLIFFLEEGSLTPERAQKIIESEPSLHKLIIALQGKQIRTQHSAISFGENNQLGDANFRNVAGGSILNITINYHSASNAYVAADYSLSTEQERLLTKPDINTDIIKASGKPTPRAQTVQVDVPFVLAANNIDPQNFASKVQTQKKEYSDGFAIITRDIIGFKDKYYEINKILSLSLLEKTRNKRAWAVVLVAPLVLPLFIAIIAAFGGQDVSGVAVLASATVFFGTLFLAVIHKFITGEKYILRIELLDRYVDVEMRAGRVYAEKLLGVLSNQIGIIPRDVR